jgi:hypothetical protein
VWDPLATVGLLLIGVLDVTRTVAVARDLGTLLATVFQQGGFGDYTAYDAARVVGWVIIAVNVVALALAIGLAVPRLRAKRTAFWIPLIAGVSCVVLTTALTVVAAAADPAFAARISG